MPSDLKQLSVPELRALVDALTVDPAAPRQSQQSLRLTAIAGEVIRRLQESEDEDETDTLLALKQVLRQWLTDRRILRRDWDDGGGFRGGPCMCSTARDKTGK